MKLCAGTRTRIISYYVFNIKTTCALIIAYKIICILYEHKFIFGDWPNVIYQLFVHRELSASIKYRIRHFSVVTNECNIQP